MRKLIVVLAVLLAAALGVVGLSGHASAGSYQPGTPSPPAGYTQTYSHNFATQGVGDWVTQPGASAHVLTSGSFGLGVEMTSTGQWAEEISSSAVLTPNSLVKALVYIPPGSGSRPDGATFPAGSTANWPAWWTSGSNWPADGEIDALEGQTGRSCAQTHYGTSGEISSPSHCGPVSASDNAVSTGWITVSYLRTGGTVKVWYGTTYIGEVPLPTTANEKLIFQNQSYSTSVCGNCFGPTVLGARSTAWLSRVTVWSLPKAGPSPTPTVTTPPPATFSCTKTGLSNNVCGAYRDPADFPPSNGFDTYIENQDVGASPGDSATLQSNGLPGSPQYVSTLTVPNNGGAVQIFTSVQQLFNDWNATARNWSGSSNVPVSSLSALTVNYNETSPADAGTGSQWEWAVDLWSSGYKSDVMFWTDTTPQRCQPGGYGPVDLGQLTLNGKPWTATLYGSSGGEIILYEDGPSGTASTCARDASGSVDVLGGLQWLQTHGTATTGFPASGNDVSMINSGWEVTQSAKGDQFRQNSLSYTVTPG